MGRVLSTALIRDRKILSLAEGIAELTSIPVTRLGSPLISKGFSVNPSPHGNEAKAKIKPVIETMPA